MTLLADSLFTPLFALDRLNSWLRADKPFMCPIRSALRSTIYWTKTQAILATSKQMQIGLRRVMVPKSCRRCDGTGQWVPNRWNGWEANTYLEYRSEYGEPCWGCNGTGTAKLKFIETTIGPIRWHTPAQKWAMSGLDVYLPFPSFYPNGDSEYELSTGWEPNRPGRPMQIADVERDMLLLLRAWPHDVCFAIECDHRIGCSPHWHCSDVQLASEWLRKLCATQRISHE